MQTELVISTAAENIHYKLIYFMWLMALISVLWQISFGQVDWDT